MLSSSARGFGGLAAARALAAGPGADHDRRPVEPSSLPALLYQVATAALSPADIAAPIRRIFRHQANVSVMLADATAIDVAAKARRAGRRHRSITTS